MSEVMLTAADVAALRAEVRQLQQLVVEQAERLERQAATIAQQSERIRELEARLAKNSRNSSKPPSSDPPFNKPPPRSQRKASGRKPGGQKGHRGVTRTLAEEVDHQVVAALSGMCGCGRAWSQAETALLPERRQVIEVVMRREITEHRIVEGRCACGCVQRSAFPAGVEAPVQYGPGVAALAVYLTQYQLLPYQRSADLLAQLAGIALSPGTVRAMVATAAERLQAPVAAIHDALVATPVAHADETGMRVGGGLNWLHVLSTAELSAYFSHPKRGAEALEAFGLLARFTGVLVHDHWAAYLRYDGAHAFCNAHHLRELIAIEETIPSQTWAGEMITLLCEANTAANTARAQQLQALPAARIEHFQARYDAILEAAAARNPRRPAKPGQRGRVAQSPAFNLIARLREQREGVLRFLTDLRVPFDNNQAERDVRMPKLKQKVSGCFRATGGAEQFATIRSYLSTLHKQGSDLFQALVLTFQGSPPMPRLGS
jgi:transposase